jgi:hypothetical protein
MVKFATLYFECDKTFKLCPDFFHFLKRNTDDEPGNNQMSLSLGFFESSTKDFFFLIIFKKRLYFFEMLPNSKLKENNGSKCVEASSCRCLDFRSSLARTSKDIETGSILNCHVEIFCIVLHLRITNQTLFLKSPIHELLNCHRL